MEIVRLLQDAGADHKICDNTGDTALMAAAEHGHAGVMALLLEAGAEVNQRDDEGIAGIM